MDYPKSVLGVGLVGGKFVDENMATGQQGSLIPSVWGNAVTEEISNVIKDAGDVPAEGDLSQLQKAIRKIVALVWPKASDVEVAAGVVDDKVVTPKKLRLGFAISLAAGGSYVVFPTWLGGWIIQFGTKSLPAVSAFNSESIGGVTYYTNYHFIDYPIAFPVTTFVNITTLACSIFSLQNSMAGKSASSNLNGNNSGLTRFDVAITANGVGFTPVVHWITLGR